MACKRSSVRLRYSPQGLHYLVKLFLCSLWKYTLQDVFSWLERPVRRGKVVGSTPIFSTTVKLHPTCRVEFLVIGISSGLERPTRRGKVVGSTPIFSTKALLLSRAFYYVREGCAQLLSVPRGAGRVVDSTLMSSVLYLIR
jgi:hypothetical protein